MRTFTGLSVSAVAVFAAGPLHGQELNFGAPVVSWEYTTTSATPRGVGASEWTAAIPGGSIPPSSVPGSFGGTAFGASLGSAGGLVGGFYLGAALASDVGEYAGLEEGLLFGGVGAIFGSAIGATLASGEQTTDTFGKALGGAVLGTAVGLGSAMIGAIALESGAGMVVGWALGQGLATAIGVHGFR